MPLKEMDENGNLVEIEEEISPETEKAVEDISQITDPEELKKILNGFETQQEAQADNLPKEDEPKEEIKEEPETPIEDKEVPPITPPTEDKAKTDKERILITDEYISKADPKDAAILKAIAGEELTPKALQNYINAQRLIGKRQEAAIQTETQKKAEALKQATPEEKETVSKLKQDTIIQEIKKKFPDLEIPDDPSEYKIFKKNLNYDDGDKFYELKGYEAQVEKTIEADIGELMYVRQNYQVINDAKINASIDMITSQAERMGLDLKLLGYDLTLQDGDNQVLANLVFKDGKPDPNVVKTGSGLLDGIPIIDEQQLTVKFFGTELPKILEKIKSDSRKQGFQAANDKKAEIPKTLSGGNVHGQQVKQKFTADEISTMTDLEELRKMTV